MYWRLLYLSSFTILRFNISFTGHSGASSLNYFAHRIYYNRTVAQSTCEWKLEENRKKTVGARITERVFRVGVFLSLWSSLFNWEFRRCVRMQLFSAQIRPLGGTRTYNSVRGIQIIVLLFLLQTHVLGRVVGGSLTDWVGGRTIRWEGWLVVETNGNKMIF